MNHKLLIIVITGLTAVGGSFLLSENPKPEPQTANNAEVIATPTPTKTPAPKTKQTPHLGTKPLSGLPIPSIQNPILYSSAPVPKINTPYSYPTPTATPTPHLETWFPSSSPMPTPTPLPTPSPSSSDFSGSPASTPSTTAKININTAEKTELERITGVGPVIAQRIIDYRQTNGQFQKIEDIKNVKGIGDKTFEKMKNEITI